MAGLLVLVRPHTSLLDGPRVAWWLGRHQGIRGAVFPVDPDYARHPLWSWALRRYVRLAGGHRMIPLDSQSPFGLRHLAACLHRGQAVVLFPQGTGIDQPDRADRGGYRWLVRRCRPQVFAVRISGWSIGADLFPGAVDPLFEEGTGRG